MVSPDKSGLSVMFSDKQPIFQISLLVTAIVDDHFLKSDMTRFWCAVFFVCLVSLPAAASDEQDSVLFRRDADQKFLSGIAYFRGGHFDTAAAIFQSIAREQPIHHRTTAAYIMGAKALYRHNEFRPSVALLKECLSRFPNSSYVYDARYTLGLDYVRMGNHLDGAIELLSVKEGSSDSVLTKRADRLFDILLRQYLSIDQTKTVFALARSEEMQALTLLRLTEKQIAANDVAGGRATLQKLLAMKKTIPYVARGEALQLDLGKREKVKILSIGILLPTVSDPSKPQETQVAGDMLKGYNLAIEEFNETSFVKVQLEVRETSHQPDICAQNVGELSSKSDVVAIVGPLFSNEALPAAREAQARKIPLLTPTANSIGIAAVGNYVFQLNPDYNVRGRSIAQYAVLQRKGKLFGVVSPAEGAGRLTAEAFINEVKSLGAEVLDLQIYPAGSTDLRAQLFALRTQAMERWEDYVIDFSKRFSYQVSRKLVHWGISERVVDSLMEAGAIVFVNDLFGENGARTADSLGIPRQRVIPKIDSLQYPVKNVDGIFLPIASADEIGILGSQLRYFNFNAQYYGTSDWQNLSQLNEHRQYVNDIIFTDDTYYEETSLQYINVFSTFEKKYKIEPNRFNLFAYDAMKLLLGVIERGATTRDEIAALLPTISKFPGVHSPISLTSDRINSILHILQFHERGIRRICGVDTSTKEFLQPAGK
jgi:ABC-type branched-subunit amino acid transport system substrate-binding protein